MTNCLVILYPACRQPVIAIFCLYLWWARFFFPLQSGLSISWALIFFSPNFVCAPWINLDKYCDHHCSTENNQKLTLLEPPKVKKVIPHIFNQPRRQVVQLHRFSFTLLYLPLQDFVFRHGRSAIATFALTHIVAMKFPLYCALIFFFYDLLGQRRNDYFPLYL